MAVALLITRMVLASVFGFAGAGKLFDLKGSRTAMADFGVSRWLAAPLGFSLPFFEVFIAGLLLPVSTVWWGALGSVALLAAFTLGIIINMARGKRPDCHCFGQLHTKPIGGSTLVRNGVLLIIAAVLLREDPRNPGLSLTAVLEMSGRYGLASVLGAGVFLAMTIQT